MRKVLRLKWAVWIGVAAAIAAIPMFGIRSFTITNGSMRPTIEVFDWVITAESDDFAPGDVIVFNTSQMGVVTHRIHEVKPDGTFITKGDFNKTPDEWVVTRQDIFGEKFVVVPRIGAWFNSDFWSVQLKQPRFWIGMLMLAAAMVLFWQLMRPTGTEPVEIGRHRAKKKR